MAERVRFELTSPVKGLRFSRPVHSTTLPPLRCYLNQELAEYFYLNLTFIRGQRYPFPLRANCSRRNGANRGILPDAAWPCEAPHAVRARQQIGARHQLTRDAKSYNLA